jgi:hypothetical protein
VRGEPVDPATAIGSSEGPGLGRVFIRDSTRGSKEPLRLSRKGERGWVKPRVTHLLQSMEVLAEIYPGGSLVLVLFRKATPSL